MKKPLTPKQQRFCEEYLIDLDAKNAAIRAGYSPKTAKVIGCQNLTKLNLKSIIDKELESRSERTQTDADWVLNNFKDIYNRCMQAEPIMVKIKGELVESGDFKFDSTGANRANENIGRHINFYEKDKVPDEVNVNQYLIGGSDGNGNKADEGELKKRIGLLYPGNGGPNPRVKLPCS